MLALLAPLLFALLGIAALVVDGGLAFSEQARLDARAEEVALEWAHWRSAPTDAWPAACAGLLAATPEATRCLRQQTLLPLVATLGVSAVPRSRDTPDAVASNGRSAFALDGTPTDPRSITLGALDEAGLSADTPDDVIRLARSTPLLFGWASVPAQTTGGDALDVATLQAARAAEGMTPELGGTGLRGRGFAVEGRARLSRMGSPALRVGPLLSGVGSSAGVIGIAWRLDALAQLLETLAASPADATLELGPALADPEGRLELEGVDSGCVFTPGPAAITVGSRLPAASSAPGALPLALSLPVDVAHLPVVEACDEAVLGFVTVALAASPSAPPGSLVVRPATRTVRHPNASASLNEPLLALAAQTALASASMRTFLDPAAPWSALVLRVHRLGPAS